jgi:hypothetical protein
MLWREAAKLFGYQVLAGILVVLLDAVLTRFVGRALPNVMSAIGNLIGALIFAMRRYQRYRDELGGRIFALSWRSTVFFILLLCAFLIGLTFSFPEFENPWVMAQAMGFPPMAWIVLALVGIVANIVVTAGGLKMGVRVAKRAVAKSSPGVG